MINLKSKKGITVAALTITILLFLMILSTITFSSLSSVQIKKLNKQYIEKLFLNLSELSYNILTQIEIFLEDLHIYLDILFQSVNVALYYCLYFLL